MVAGIMVHISLDELLLASEKYGEHHLSIYGIIAGIGFHDRILAYSAS